MQGAGNYPSERNWLDRLRKLGFELPHPPAPLGSYTAAVQAGELLFLSGMLPLIDGKPAVTGRVGRELSVEQGRGAALVAALNALAAASHRLGDPDRLVSVVRLGVSVAAAPDFSQHAAIAEGASRLLAQIFGEVPGHTRLAFGVESLPLGVPVLLELILAVTKQSTATDGRTEAT
ncbi:MAG TPA: RidA family protein [Acidobacteriota bacterium]|nr:RidA family protein [Acidobacteriota bacterium]